MDGGVNGTRGVAAEAVTVYPPMPRSAPPLFEMYAKCVVPVTTVTVVFPVNAASVAVTLQDPANTPVMISLPFTPLGANNTAPAGVQALVAHVTVPVSGPVEPSVFNSKAVKLLLPPT